MVCRKILLGLCCVAFVSLLHVGCAGLVGDVCQRDCDCHTNCDHNAEAICEDDELDVQSKIDAAGCDGLFNAALECELTCTCSEGALDTSKCQAKLDAVQACIAAHDPSAN